MVVAECPKIFDIQCIWRRIFVSLEKKSFSFSFYMKYIWKKGYKNFVWHIFLGAHTVQMVPKYIWMWHCMNALQKTLSRSSISGLVVQKAL